MQKIVLPSLEKAAEIHPNKQHKIRVNDSTKAADREFERYKKRIRQFYADSEKYSVLAK